MTTPIHPESTAASSAAENLRDARLAHALQHMPDAHMQPSAQTRHAVLQEALRAAGVKGHKKSRWWHAWLGQPGQRVPWSAAVASLAVVCFITVLWYGQDVPDAAPERSKEGTAPAPERKVASVPSSQPLSPAPAAPAVANADKRKDSISKAKVAELAEVARPQAREAVALGAAPAPTQSDASPPQRSAAGSLDRSEAKALAQLNTRPVVTMTQGSVTRSVSPGAVTTLLNVLRGLTYGPVPDLPYREASNADLVVEIAGQERWVIAPDAVHYQSLAAPARTATSDITPAQYADLRRLAMEPTVQP